MYCRPLPALSWCAGSKTCPHQPLLSWGTDAYNCGVLRYLSGCILRTSFHRVIARPSTTSCRYPFRVACRVLSATCQSILLPLAIYEQRRKFCKHFRSAPQIDIYVNVWIFFFPTVQAKNLENPKYIFWVSQPPKQVPTSPLTSGEGAGCFTIPTRRFASFLRAMIPNLLSYSTFFLIYKYSCLLVWKIEKKILIFVNGIWIIHAKMIWLVSWPCEETSAINRRDLFPSLWLLRFDFDPLFFFFLLSTNYFFFF